MTRADAFKRSIPPSSSRLAAPLSAAVVALACAGCGSSDDDDFSLMPFSTPGHVVQMRPLALAGNWMIYVEEENSPAGLQDLNGNGSTNDSVAVAVSMGGVSIFPMAVAPRAAHVVGDQLYFEVDEGTDGRDWNGDGDGGLGGDLVLLHWAFQAASVPNGMGQCNAAGVCFVDDLLPSASTDSAIAAGGRLFYSANVPDLVLTASGDGATTLRALEQAAPRVPVEVFHLDTGQRRPLLLDEEGGVLFLAYDETLELLDQNGDADDDDTLVLALLDATMPLRGIQSTARALPSVAAPLRARRNTALTDWLVAFLVSEADQGGASLNDRDSAEFTGTAWEPVQCNASPDTDTADVVLHFLNFEAWFADPVAFPARNTGLVGRDPLAGEPDRVQVVEGFVALVSDEVSANCDLNGDADTVDSVARWTAAVADPLAPVLPPGDVTELEALATGIAGGSQGFSTLDNRFVTAVDEAADAEDHDGDAQMNVLVASRNPAAPALTPWSFLHAIGSPVVESVGTTWMAPLESELRLPISFQESVQGQSLNSACNDLSLADADTTDELPTWPRFSGDLLVVPGVGLGLSPAKAGIVVAHGFAFYRLSEAEQGADLDGDGVMGFLIGLSPVFACSPTILHAIPDDPTADGTTPVVFTDGLIGAAFVASETDTMRDLNANGFVGEDVMLYFTLP